MTTLSVIISAYNEASNLPTLRKRLLEALEPLDVALEIVLVDDHSSDQTPQLIDQWAAEDGRVTSIRLSRNCGSHAAYSAGLRNCRGDLAVILAADLQDPPELIPRLISESAAGFDMVWARRRARQDIDGKGGISSSIANWIFEKTLPNWPKGGVDFFLVNRRVVDAYKSIPEKNTSFVAVLLWMGFNQTVIDYEKESRLSGVSKWTLARKIRLFVDCMVAFSDFPVRMASYLGLAFSLLGFIYAFAVILWRIAGQPVTGWASTIVVVLVLGGVQLLVLGILGEYLWRTFDEARRRPAYIIEKMNAAKDVH
jgi:glycosyltransferase involved in cell wall biosynthesis